MRGTQAGGVRTAPAEALAALDTTSVRARYMFPPALRDREIIFEFGLSKATGSYFGPVMMWDVYGAWLREHLPFQVVLRSMPPTFDRNKARRWLNRETSGLWSWSQSEGMLCVVFTDEIDASAFRIVWG